MKRPIIEYILLLFLIILSGCTYHNEEEYFTDENDCNTNDISFAKDVFPVIERSCISCHGSISPTAGIELSNYSAVKAVAQSGKLLGAIRHDDGFVAMPRDAEKLTDCTIEKFEAWMEQDFPQ